LTRKTPKATLKENLGHYKRRSLLTSKKKKPFKRKGNGE